MARSPAATLGERANADLKRIFDGPAYQRCFYARRFQHVTGAADAALALQRVGDAAFDASHRAYLRALGAVDHGQRTEDFMDSAQQIGVSTARAGIRAASSYRRRDRRQVL
jgi:hypothetical protein